MLYFSLMIRAEMRIMSEVRFLDHEMRLINLMSFSGEHQFALYP